jgi:rubrerythrin
MDESYIIELCRALGLLDEGQGRIVSVPTVDQVAAKIKQLRRDTQALVEVEEELADLKDVINDSLPHYHNSDEEGDECNEAEKVEAAGDTLRRMNTNGQRRIDSQTAWIPPFGFIYKCGGCGCLVAGGPTACGRCVQERER